MEQYVLLVHAPVSPCDKRQSGGETSPKHLGSQDESILLAHVFESDQKHTTTFSNIPNKLKTCQTLVLR